MSKMERVRAPAATLIKCRVSDLRNAVAAVSTVIERRHTIPVLGCLRMDPVGAALVISGTNLDAWVAVKCPAEPAIGAPICLDAGAMRRLLAWAPGDDEVTISRETELLTIQIGAVTATKRDLIPAGDWPEEPKVTAKPTEIGEAALVKLIDSVRFAISTEETRYYLNGIYLTAINGNLAGVATDGHRIARYCSAEPWPWASVIFPRNTVRALRDRLVPGGNRTIRVAVDADRHMIRLLGDDWHMTCKVIDGTFPDYTRVIPPRVEDPGYAVLSLDTLRRLPEPVNHSSAAIKLDLPAARASFRDYLEGMDVSLPIEARGGFSVGFNGKYLRQVARAFGTFRLEATSASDAAHLLTEDPALTIVLMPMKVG